MHRNRNAAEENLPAGRESSWIFMRTVLLVILALIIWFLIYRNLSFFADWYTYEFGRFPRPLVENNKDIPTCPCNTQGLLPYSGNLWGIRWGQAIYFLLFQVPHTFMLLSAVIFLMGNVRSYFTPERTRAVLAAKQPFVGYALAALFGIVAPFCSCSAIPLFIGFVTAGVPLGVTFTFLTASPIVDEIAAALIMEKFGLKIMLMYVLTGLTIALVTGWIISRCRMERYVEDWVSTVSHKKEVPDTPRFSFDERVRMGLAAVKDILGKVWLYLVVSLVVSAILHAFVSREFFLNLLGRDRWWSVPLAVGIGIPTYATLGGILPIVNMLIDKGIPLGTILAFMMAVVALSLPEFIILRRVLKLRLLLVFAGIVSFGIMLVGILFNTLL